MTTTDDVNLEKMKNLSSKVCANFNAGSLSYLHNFWTPDRTLINNRARWEKTWEELLILISEEIGK